MNRRSVLGALAGTGVLAAQAAESDEVSKAEMAFSAALVKTDLAALERLLANDLIYTHSSATVETKAEYMAKLKTGEQKYASMKYSNIKIRVYGGGTAVLNARVALTGSTKGTPFNNTLLMIHVWVKQGGRWQMVAHQTTRVTA